MSMQKSAIMLVILVLTGFTLNLQLSEHNSEFQILTNVKWTWSSSSEEGIPTNIIVSDLNNDGFKETIFGTTNGFLIILSSDGSEVKKYSLTPEYELTSPAIGDIDGDGKPEVVIGSMNGTLFILNYTDIEWKYSFSSCICSIALWDIDKDGKDDIILISGSNLEILYDNGTSVEEINIESDTFRGNLAIGDIDGDNNLEAVITGNSNLIWIVKLASKVIMQKDLREETLSVPILADINRDGKEEIFVLGKSGKIYALSSDLDILWTFNSMSPYSSDLISSHIIIGDIDYDGFLDIIFSLSRFLFLLTNNGTLINKIALKGDIRSIPALADINGDFLPELITSTGKCEIKAVRWNGDIVLQYNASIPGQNLKVINSITVDDLDGNKRDEIIFIDNSGRIVALEYPTTSGLNNYWATYKGDNKRTGNMHQIDSDSDCVVDSIEILYNMEVGKWDTDSDGMPDGWEYFHELNPSDPRDKNYDPDGDGLTNYEEFIYRTDPKNFDTDKDGIPDPWEIDNGLNPRNATDSTLDFDNDNLTNYDEFKYGTNPWKNDTDDDGMPDGWEVANKFNPTDPSDANADSDLDGLSNLEEYHYGTNPHNSDTDGDVLDDGKEILIGTNPLDPDTDKDGLSDGEEVAKGTNPLSPDTDNDFLPDNVDPFPTIRFLPLGLIPIAIAGLIIFALRNKIKEMLIKREEKEKERPEEKRVKEMIKEILES